MTENILHVSTLHSQNSSRITHKYIKVGREIGNKDVYLCGQTSTTGDPIYSISNKKIHGWRRILALFIIPFLVRKFNHKWVQIHDPELLLCIPLLKLISSKRVIYDLHEDFPVQYTANHNKSKIFEYFLKVVEVFFIKISVDRLVCATPFIFNKYRSYKRAYLIENNPIDITQNVSNKKMKDIDIIYAGLMSPNRGIIEFLDQLDECQSQLRIVFAGPYSSEIYRREVESHRNFSRITYEGYLTKLQVNQLYKRSKCGLILLKQSANYEVARPTKLFEYANFGMKILTTETDFLTNELKNQSFVHFLNSKGSDWNEIKNFVSSEITESEQAHISAYLQTIESFRSQYEKMLREL